VEAVQLILEKAANSAKDLGLYVIFGVLLGEALRYTPGAQWLERLCRQKPSVSVLSSAMLGMASPLCTYGTVPVVLELLRSGVPAAPLVTFLAASSLMNPQLLVMTWGGLGGRMALARLGSVLAFSLLLGAVVHGVPKRWAVLPVLISNETPQLRRKRTFTWADFAKRGWHTLEFVGFYVLLGILIGAAVEVLVPGRWIFALFGTGGWLQILLAALLGVPLYACGGGTIPLVQSLLTQGMAAGAALAFLIAGPATRVAPLMALSTILRPAFVAAYVGALVLYSVAVGVLFGLI